MNRFESTPISSVESYWDRRPCNVRHSPLPVGTREYFDQVEERKYLVEPHIPGFAEFGRWAGKRVLEIGCGIGTDTMNFARAGAEVVAVDLSEESLALARRRSEIFELTDRIRFVHSNAEELDGIPDDARFDLVYSFGVIHHTPHPGRVLEQVRRRLAPGASVRLMVYNRRSWKVAEVLVREGKGRIWDLDRVVADHSEAETGCPVTYTYTRQGVRQLLAGADLRVIRTQVDHIFPYRIRDYVQYRYVKRFPFNVLPQPLTGQLEHRLGWHLLVWAVAAGSSGSGMDVKEHGRAARDAEERTRTDRAPSAAGVGRHEAEAEREA